MRAIIQRVKKASVSIDDSIISEIKKGIVVFIGVYSEDDINDAKYIAHKIPDCRIFEDKDGKMNLSAKELNLEILVVPNFTLCGECKSGNRPSFDRSAQFEKAFDLYSEFVNEIKKSGIKAKEGRFREKMLVTIENDGPVTFLLDSR